MSAAQISVPQVVSRKLSAVRGRRRLLTFLAGTTLAAAVFCGLLLAAMLLDWLTTPFSSAPRVLLTATVLLGGAAAFLIWALRPALRRSSLPAVAGLVDEAVPELEERWTTIADLSQSNDPPEMRGSNAMLGRVADEAERMHELVRPQQIVSTRIMGRSLWALGGVVTLLAAVWLIDREQTSVLWQRFWSPTQPISLTQVTSPTAGAVVPRHESIDIVGALAGRLRDNSTIWVRDVHGAVAEHAMSASTTNPAEFVFPVEKIDQPLEYRIRSGDGQTPWYTIDVAERPQLSNIEFRIMPPKYSRLPAVQQNGLPRRVRALEGSILEVTFTATEPLTEFSLQLEDESRRSAERVSECVFRLQQKLEQDFAFSPILTNKYGLTNERPPSCHIIVYRDEVPAVSIVSPESDTAVRPDDAIEVEFQAKDDFGISRAELVITDATHPEATPLKVVEIPLGEQQNRADVKGTVPLDLKEFNLKHGASLSYSVRVFDTKDSTGESRQSASSSSTHEANQQSNHSDAKTAENPGAAPQNDQVKPNEDNALAKSDAAQQQQSDAKPNDAQSQSSQSPSSQSQSSQSKSSKTAKSSEDESPKGRMEGAPKPGDNMQRRELALGQCSSCKPMNLKIDEWAGSFLGQQRAKLEIAIEEFLARMETALRAAETENQQVFDQVTAGTPWGEEQVIGSRKAAGNLGTASDVAVELAATSANTPYAFMGLQLVEIDERHIVPAQSILQGIAQTPDADRPESLKSSLFHIRRARELLAKLSRTYEGVKINHQLSEAMTHVKKMHQVFIEDAFKMLGDSRPVLNPKQRKFIEFELDEEFRAKLKALLEKKRDVQAELAKVLAQNPELLRRFMAQARVDADSLRDQMTLLARRQVELQAETSSLIQTPESADAILAAQQARHSLAAIEISKTAALMFENFETWLPRDLKLTDPAIEPVHRLFQELAISADQLAVAEIDVPAEPEASDRKTTDDTPEADSAAEPAPAEESAEAKSPEPIMPNHGQRVYELLNRLQDELPKLAETRPGHGKLTTHVTNRLAEVAKLNTVVSGWLKTSEAFEQQDRDLIALIEQSNVTNDTAELTNKIANLQSWMSGLTEEIAGMSDDLQATLEDELLVQQATAEEAFAAHAVPHAEQQQSLAVASFEKSEAQFDRLLEAIIAYLDSQPVNTRPSLDGAEAETLEELLAMLDNEKLAAEGLGIPCCRPSNLSIVRDWMSPGKSGGMGGSMAAGSMAQALAAQLRAGRLQKTAEDRKRQLLAEAEQAGKQQQGRRPINPRWNTLQSRLDDSLSQSRGQAPPPKYRSAIELYFELISGVSSRDTQSPPDTQ